MMDAVSAFVEFINVGMKPVYNGFAWAFLILGTVLSFIGVIGFYRLPDVYTRLHATGKVSVLGLVSLLVAAILINPTGLGWKSVLLIFFVLLSAPSVAHSIASAAYKNGLRMEGASRDDLAPKLPREK
jgi:multicomponent Na+:H+ antiporter subunit G